MAREKVPNKLLDELIEKHHLRSDAHLADELKYGRSKISEIRHAVRPVTGEFRCAIMRRFGMSLKRIDSLAPPDDGKGAK